MSTLLSEYFDGIEGILKEEKIIFKSPRIALDSLERSYIVRGPKIIVMVKDKKNADALKGKLDAFAASCKTSEGKEYKVAVKVRPAEGVVRVTTTNVVTTEILTGQGIINEIKKIFRDLLDKNKKEKEEFVKKCVASPIQEDLVKRLEEIEKDYEEAAAKIEKDRDKEIKAIKKYCKDLRKFYLLSYYTGKSMWRVSFYNPEWERRETITFGDVVILYGKGDIEFKFGRGLRKKRNDNVKSKAGLVIGEGWYIREYDQKQKIVVKNKVT